MNILVVGGAGYVGSHMAKNLVENNHDVIVLDNLSTGHEDAITDCTFIEGCIGDSGVLNQIFGEHDIDAVMHFAANIEVGESVINPGKYYKNNCSRTLNLLDSMVDHGVDKFIFSSTAAVFGEPESQRIDEEHSRQPISPYGRSKLFIEHALEDYEHAHKLHHVCLRYFNAAGAHPSGQIGERHDPETHLIPLVLQAVSGRRDSISVFGTDYETADGSCIRDYVHVCDLADAHHLALQYLVRGGESASFNLGNGNGYSVLEVIETAKKVTGIDFNVELAKTRTGDPACLVADSGHAKKVLGWTPQYSALETIIDHAWRWEQTLKNSVEFPG